MKKELKFFNKLLVALLLVIISISLLFTLSGCQSTDKGNAYLSISNASFDYSSSENKTYITWEATINNSTIYDINAFKIKIKLYENSVDFVETKALDYTANIRRGDDSSTNIFKFSANGNIDHIELDSWSANYDNFWDTYKAWIITTIIVLVVASIIYVCIMIVQDLYFDDVIYFIEDLGEYAILLLIVCGGGILAIILSHWVPVVIIISGIVIFALVIVISHLIKFIIEEASFGYCVDEDDEDDEDDYIETNTDYSQYFNQSTFNKSTPDYSSYFDDDEEEENDTSFKVPKQKKNKKGITFADIAGLEEAKQAFKEKVVYAFEHRALYEKYGKKVGGGLLLYGLPGTGKTMFAEAASNETDALFIPIKCSDIKSKWYGESEQNVKKIFDTARKAKKAIIFFDEFEAIGAKRTDDGNNGNNDLVPQILAEMQGINSNNSKSMILVIAATNKPWSIDSAFLRPGRFDEKIYIPLPDLAARKKLFELKLSSIPHENLNYDYFAEISDGFNGADIGEFCDRLKMIAINRAIETGKETPINMSDVIEIKDIVKSSVSDEDIEKLKEFT